MSVNPASALARPLPARLQSPSSTEGARQSTGLRGRGSTSPHPLTESRAHRPLGLGLRGVGGVGASLAARHVAGRAGGAREADLSPEDWNRTERATPEADGDSGRRREIA